MGEVVDLVGRLKERIRDLAHCNAKFWQVHDENTRLREEISECARLIPIWGSLPDRIRFLLRQPRSIEDGAIDYPKMMVEQRAGIERLREALEQIANVDYFSEPRGEPLIQIARAALHTEGEEKR